jgi:hypothetical protein
MSLLSISTKIGKMVLIQILKILQDEYKAKNQVFNYTITITSLGFTSYFIFGNMDSRYHINHSANHDKYINSLEFKRDMVILNRKHKRFQSSYV